MSKHFLWIPRSLDKTRDTPSPARPYYCRRNTSYNGYTIYHQWTISSNSSNSSHLYTKCLVCVRV